MTTSVAKKVGNAFTVNDNKACSDGRCEKNECGDGETPTVRGRIFTKEPICHRCG